MPRTAGVSGKYKKIQKNVARRRKMPASEVKGGLVRTRLDLDLRSMKARKTAGVKVRRRSYETLDQMLKRFKKGKDY